MAKTSERRKRGFLLLGLGVAMMLTRLIGLDQVFVFCGVVFAGLGFGDIFFDDRYKRRF